MESELWWSVSVPTALLGDRSLTPESRALYMILLDQCTPKTGNFSSERLTTCSGVTDRRTVCKHLEQLEAAGWLRVCKIRRGQPPQIDLQVARSHRAWRPAVKVPGSLINIPELSLAARWLYAVMQMQPSTRPSVRQVDLLELAGWTSRNTVRTVVTELNAANWLVISKHHGKAGGSVYMPLDPHLAVRRQIAEEVSMRLDQVQHRGEPMLKELLDVIVIDKHYINNARPGSFANPLSDEPLELDRLYPTAKVAVEYNGAQHYRTTTAFPDPVKLRKQQAHDLMKRTMAAENEITLVTFRATELLPAIVAKKLAPYLPLRPLRYEDPVLGYLLTECRKHVAKAKRGEFTD